MRLFLTIVVGLALTALLWANGAPAAFGDGHDDVDVPLRGDCQPGPPFVPGTSVGPIAIGTTLDAVRATLGRPVADESRLSQGHRWVRLVYPGLHVLGMDNAVVALVVPQNGWIPVRTSCGTIVARPLYLPAGNIVQLYGPAPVSLAANGLQYLVYNRLGLLFTVPAAGGPLRGLTVYRSGQYCTVVPRLVAFGWFTVQAGSVLRCDAAGEDRPQHEGPVH